MPITTSGIGFSKAIVDQQFEGRETRKLIREYVKFARELIQLDIKSLKLVDVLWFEELQASASAPSSKLHPVLTQEQRAGSMYFWVMHELELALKLSRRVEGNAISRCMKPLAKAAEMLRLWTVSRANGNSQPLDKYIKEQRQFRTETNRKNAKRKRPNARTTDHDEILLEFKTLCAIGHTDRQARGILLMREVASKSTIGRITKTSP